MGMMWFIFSEVMFFAAFFGALFYARNFAVPWLSGDGVKIFTKILLWNDYGGVWPTNGPAAVGPRANGTFETIPALGLPALNTAILLTSSLTMVLAVQAVQENNLKWLVRYLVFTILLACAFLMVKGLEYHEDLAEHLWPGPHFKPGLPAQAQIFWFLYWSMTGLHALHVTVGIVLLSIMAWMSHRRVFSAQYYNPVDVSALYWHFVDIVWIFLYPLLYLINRSS